MGKFQVFVLVSVVTCAIISMVQSVPVKDSSVESENAAKCKTLCGYCGCTGYYCGDECLCECNSQNEGEAECVDVMKSNCKKLDLPFEVLIQGPNVNRMVRSLLYADPSEEVCIQSAESNQKKRSTISIYKPDEKEQQDKILSVPTSHKDEAHNVHHDDSPIQIIVAQNLDTKEVPVETELIDRGSAERSEAAINAEPNDKSENDESPIPNHRLDDVDRKNSKRHIIDINQDISDLITDSEHSLVYKRDTEDEVKEEIKEEEVKEEDVGAAAPAAAPASPAPLLPKIQEAFQNMRAQIPTSAEIKTAWETVRKEVNSKINTAIADARKRAADLRNKLTPPPPPPPPPAPVKFNPFLRSENEENDVGMALLPLIPVIPPVPALPAATPLAIQADINKGIAQFRANNKIIQENARKEANNIINTLSKNPWFITPVR